MRGSVGGVDTSREIAVSALELHRGDRSRAVEWDQLGAGGLCIRDSGLTSSVGHELLLVDIHLALDFGVLPLVGPGREGRLWRVGVGPWSDSHTGAL